MREKTKKYRRGLSILLIAVMLSGQLSGFSVLADAKTGSIIEQAYGDDQITRATPTDANVASAANTIYEKLWEDEDTEDLPEYGMYSFEKQDGLTYYRVYGAFNGKKGFYACDVEGTLYFPAEALNLKNETKVAWAPEQRSPINCFAEEAPDEADIPSYYTTSDYYIYENTYADTIYVYITAAGDVLFRVYGSLDGGSSGFYECNSGGELLSYDVLNQADEEENALIPFTFEELSSAVPDCYEELTIASGPYKGETVYKYKKINGTIYEVCYRVYGTYENEDEGFYASDQYGNLLSPYEPLDTNDDVKNAYVEAVIPAPFKLISAGGASLTLKVAGDNGIWYDVDELPTPNETTWNFVNVPTKQIQIQVGFPTGTVQERALEVVIPPGYIITEMSANDAWTAPSGIKKLDLSTEDNSKVQSVNLTDRDGGTWPQAIPMGPIPPADNYYSRSISAATMKDGQITYLFNGNCDAITLTLTLCLDQSIMPHDATSNILADITAVVTSGTDTLEESLTTTVTGLVVPSMGGSTGTDLQGGTRQVAGTVDGGDDTKGTVPLFATGYYYSCYNQASQNHWVESVTRTFNYPEGVTFQGFSDNLFMVAGDSLSADKKMVDTDFTNSGGLEVYELASGNGGGHLTVTHDPVARKVTFDYANTYLLHSGGGPITFLYWMADVNQNGSPIQWGQTLSFPMTYTETGGILSGNQQPTSERSVTVSITVSKPVDFDIRATGINRTRQDWNAYADGAFPYDYMLGQFDVENAAPNDFTGMLRYVFAFDDSLAVRGLSLPGIRDNNFSNVVATVTDGTNTRTITLPGPFAVTNTSQNSAGYTFDSVKLGLAAAEYITAFQIDQAGLGSVNMNQPYVYSSTSYFGRWQEGTEGDAKVEVYEINAMGARVAGHTTGVVTSHTAIGWTQAGAGSSTVTYSDKNGTTNTTGSFNPTDIINFRAALGSGPSVSHSNEICDPVIYISLPAGIELDINSVQGMSQSGTYGLNSWFDLKGPLSTKTWTGGSGVTWTTYGFTSVNKLDMVARATHLFSSSLQPSGYSSMEVKFSAVVNSTCETYSNLAAKDMVIWDLGQTAVSVTASTDYTFNDTNDVAEKGTSYKVVGAVTSVPLNIVQKPALNVNLGIRVADPANTYTVGNYHPAFGTYNGLASSIAPVSVDRIAELWVKYENTSATSYKTGSEIYLPVPKAGIAYDHYFNNTEVSDPLNTETNAAPEWTAFLTGPVSLPGFTTYYTTDSSDVTAAIPVGGAGDTWTPVDFTFTSATSGWTSSDWADVTMIKFVADAEIPSGATGEMTFEFGVDSDAVLGQVNYWRSYQKGWREDTGAGTWMYGAVVAAEPAKAGITGMVFHDKPVIDGEKAAAGEDFNNASASAAGVTAMLTEANTLINPMNLTMNADGSFASLDPISGVQYFLKSGTYTVTFTNNTGGLYRFTNVTPVTRSYNDTSLHWYMDIPQANISADGKTATYTFTVDERSTTSTEYIGVGMRTALYTLTYNLNTTDTTAAFSAAGVASQDDIEYNTLVNATTSYLSNTGNNKPTRAGYTFGGWYNEPGCTTAADTTAMTANKTVYAKWTMNSYNITYSYSNQAPAGALDPATLARTAAYNSAQAVAGAPTMNGYTFSGWSTASTGVSIDAGGNFTMPDHDVVFTGSWTTNRYTVSYAYTENAEGSIPAGVPDKPSDTSVDYATSQTVAPVPAPAPAGYTFSGWITVDAIVTGDSFTMPAGNVRFFGSWEKNPSAVYKVEHYYVDASGTAAGTPFETAALNGTIGTAAAASAKTGLVGYTYDSAFVGTLVNGTIAADGSLVLKLYYRVNTHSITYAYTGTIPTGVPAKPADVADAAYNSAQTVAAAPTMAGGIFSGWTTADATVSAGGFTMPDQDVIFTGSWQLVDCPVVFMDSNPSTKEATIQIGETKYVEFGSAVMAANVPANPYKSGYTFTGWLYNGQLYTDTQAAAYLVNSESGVTFIAQYRSTGGGGGDGGGGGGTTPINPTNPTNPTNPADPTDPQTPTVPTNPTVTPPAVLPGHTAEPTNDPRIYVEYDDNGIPLGAWRLSDDNTTWIFDPEIPLAGLAKTGDSQTAKWMLLSLSCISMFGLVLVTRSKKKWDEE